MAQWLRKRFPKNKEELRNVVIEQLTGLLKALLFYAVVLAILYFCSWLLGEWKLLNPLMKGEVAIDMLKAVINVDSALIGFTGVISVFGLREISRTIERARGRPRLSKKDEGKLEAWQTNFQWTLLLTVLMFAASILASLGSISYTTSCTVLDNVVKCIVFDPQSSSSFLLPLYAMFLGIAGTVWVVWSLRNPFKNGERLEITMRLGFMGQGASTSEILLYLEAANVGDRPVSISSLPSLLLPDEMQLVLIEAGKLVSFPYVVSPGQRCEVWQAAEGIARSLDEQGYAGEIDIVGRFKDDVGNEYKSKRFRFDIDEWLPGAKPPKSERRYMKRCVSCRNWIPLASETCSACNTKQPERLSGKTRPPREIPIQATQETAKGTTKGNASFRSATSPVVRRPVRRRARRRRKGSK